MDTMVQVEGVLVDVDFKTHITRDKFEAMSEEGGLYARVAKPFQDALKAASLKPKDISALLVVGGAQVHVHTCFAYIYIYIYIFIPLYMYA